VDRGDGDRSEGVSTIEQVVSQVVGVDGDSVDASSSPESVEGWDSMGHLNLVAALEQRFNVSIDIGDAMEMVSVRRIREILRDYGVQV
jgi:acyl carrier protein